MVRMVNHFHNVKLLCRSHMIPRRTRHLSFTSVAIALQARLQNGYAVNNPALRIQHLLLRHKDGKGQMIPSQIHEKLCEISEYLIDTSQHPQHHRALRQCRGGDKLMSERDKDAGLVCPLLIGGR